jgi:hypothetical protein
MPSAPEARPTSGSVARVPAFGGVQASVRTGSRESPKQIDDRPADVGLSRAGGVGAWEGGE